jgi:hypothetical protein
MPEESKYFKDTSKLVFEQRKKEWKEVLSLKKEPNSSAM